jgi:hypothetical protein
MKEELEEELQWSYVEAQILQLLSNEKRLVRTAMDAQAQSDTAELLVARIKRTFDSLAEDAWKYRELN